MSEGLKTRFTLGVLTCQGDVRIEDHRRNHLRPHGCRPHVVGVVVHRERRPLSREVRVARSMPTKPELGSNNNEFEVLYLPRRYFRRAAGQTNNNNESSSPPRHIGGRHEHPRRVVRHRRRRWRRKSQRRRGSAFFTRAGLPQASLATLRELADNPPRGFLDRKQFGVAMQLITVAQVRTRVCHRVVFSLFRTRGTIFAGDLARSRERRPVGRNRSSAFQTSRLRCHRSDVAHLRRAAVS